MLTLTNDLTRHTRRVVQRAREATADRLKQAGANLVREARHRWPKSSKIRRHSRDRFKVDVDSKGVEQSVTVTNEAPYVRHIRAGETWDSFVENLRPEARSITKDLARDVAAIVEGRRG